MSILGYNKKSGSDAWESIPTLELKDIIDANMPKDAGEDDGANNLPLSEEIELSKTEASIICQAEEHLQFVQELATKDKTDSHRAISQLDIADLLDDFEDIKNTPDAKFTAYTSETKNELINLRVDERNSFSNLRHFKARNNLVRPASYPSSLKFHIGVLMLFLLGESIANMYFFAEGSSIGLLGGFFNATLISVVNIALSYVIGMFVLVQFNHRFRYRKVIAGVITTLYIVAISIYHLLVAHFRDLLSIDPDNATLLVWARLIDAPFTFNTMESAMVLIIGFVIAVLACHKGYRHDDVYPGYGQVSKEYEKRNNAFNKKSKEITIKLNNIIQSSQDDLNNRMKEYEQRIKSIKDRYCHLESHASQYSTMRTTLDSTVDTAITIYRKSNQGVRITPPPLYFSNKIKIIDTLSEEKDFFELDKINVKIRKSEETLLRLRKNAADVSRYLGNKTKNIHSEIDIINTQIDKTSNKIVKDLLEKVADAHIYDDKSAVLERT